MEGKIEKISTKNGSARDHDVDEEQKKEIVSTSGA
jgi:hypothetical protein